MSLRYSFRSEHKKFIFQFKGKCTSVAQLKKHIEYQRGIINIDVINPLTETIYDNTYILKRGSYVEIRTCLETTSVSNHRVPCPVFTSVFTPVPTSVSLKITTKLKKRAEIAARKRQQQNVVTRTFKQSFKRRKVTAVTTEIVLQHISKGIPKRLVVVPETKHDIGHLNEHLQTYKLQSQGDASLNL